MTDLDELKALHERWLIGTCDDAEMAQEAVMETHFLALIERLERAEGELHRYMVLAFVADGHSPNAAHEAASRALGERDG